MQHTQESSGVSETKEQVTKTDLNASSQRKRLLKKNRSFEHSMCSQV